jgi:hypothetical protein
VLPAVSAHTGPVLVVVVAVEADVVVDGGVVVVAGAADFDELHAVSATSAHATARHQRRTRPR